MLEFISAYIAAAMIAVVFTAIQVYVGNYIFLVFGIIFTVAMLVLAALEFKWFLESEEAKEKDLREQLEKIKLF